MKTQQIYTLLLVLTLGACAPAEQSGNEDAGGALSKEQLAAADIRTAPLTKRLLEQTVRVNGFIDVPPNQKAEVHALLAGFVSEIPVIVGDKVQKGQLLAQLLSPEFITLQQAYLEQKSVLKSLEQEYARLKALSDEKISSQKDFQAAESAYLSAKTRLTGTASQLRLLGVNAEKLTPETMQDKLVIRAPLSGEITQTPIVIGRHVSSGDMLFQILNTEHIHAELKVFETDLTKLKLKQAVRLLVAQLGKEPVMGSIYQMTTSINETGRYGMVHVHFDKEWSNAQIGAYVEAEIIVEAREVWAVEEAAVISDAEGSRIFVVKPGDMLNIVPMAVKTGERRDGWIELLNMPEGIRYVAKGAYYLANR